MDKMPPATRVRSFLLHTLSSCSTWPICGYSFFQTAFDVLSLHAKSTVNESGNPAYSVISKG